MLIYDEALLSGQPSLSDHSPVHPDAARLMYYYCFIEMPAGASMEERGSKINARFTSLSETRDYS